MELEALYALIRRFEGCWLKAYLCPAGVWTVGWGSTGVDVGPATRWTQEEADDRMERDALRFARLTVAMCPILFGQSDALSALSDFCYNLGPGALRASTLRKKILAEDWPAAREQLARWVRGGGRVLPGLVLRRRAEAELLPS